MAVAEQSDNPTRLFSFEMQARRNLFDIRSAAGGHGNLLAGQQEVDRMAELRKRFTGFAGARLARAARPGKDDLFSARQRVPTMADGRPRVERVSRIFFERAGCLLCYLRVALEDRASMAEKLVLVGVIPEIVVIGPEEQVVWLSDTGNLKIQFDPNRCPFQSNMFQAPPGRQLQSGPPRPGTNPGSFKYRLWLNDQPVGHGEVILREK
jgi:hypothetical protein